MGDGLPIYLDCNATTPVEAVVREAMVPWLGERWGNASSAHAYGRAAAEAVAWARGEVADLVGGRSEEIVFTGGGTEADNLAVVGTRTKRRRVVVSAVEHPAVEAPSLWLQSQGWVRDVLGVDGRGVVDVERAREVLAEPAGLVSVILAQNETGVIQPVGEVAALAKAAADDVVVHSDGAQAVGKIAVDVEALGVDLLTIVSHKLYGPCGIGALWVRPGIEIEALTRGGGQEGGVRPGTEPVALIVGLGAACRLARAELASEGKRQRGLKEELWRRLREGVPGVRRTGEGAETLPNTLHVRFDGISGAQVLAAAPEIAASTGSACHADDEAASGVLGAMGLEAADAAGAVRLSLGRHTSAEDIAVAADALVRAATRR